MNEFAADDMFQREKRERYILPWYESFANVTCVDTLREFQGLGIDTILIRHDNRHVVNVEEKVVRWPGYKYEAFTLETDSCTVLDHESPGWMCYSRSDRLLYCFETEQGQLDCWWIDFPCLQKWFWERLEGFARFQMKEKNKTAGRVVPIEDVAAEVPLKNFSLPAG
jgi:hypothetical protein